MHGTPPTTFFGWRVTGGAFVLAVFGWGVGFYGPPVYLHNVVERTGWPVPLVSVAVTFHFLIGAVVVANLPRLYRRFGLPAITTAGAMSLGAGVLGWAIAASPWQLFAAALFSGVGWVAMGAAAVNAIIAPWFVRKRPAALATAYNGASIGGVVFSPLWVFLIGQIGFTLAASGVGIAMVLAVLCLSAFLFSKTPQLLGQHPDGDTAAVAAPSATASAMRRLPGRLLWRDQRFITLATGMALGLFAQIGLIAHLFSLLVPALGAQQAGIAMGAATAAAIAGRTAVGWMMGQAADRRLIACAAYAVQIAGSLVFIAADGNTALLWLGVILFGSGIGNATSLPPLIAQVEFAREDTQRVVSLIVAIGQGTYAFAPAAFGVARALSTGNAAWFFAAASLIQVAAIVSFALGRRRAGP